MSLLVEPPPGRGRALPSGTRWIAAAVVVLFWSVLGVLTVGADLPLLDGVLLAVLLVAVPGLSLAQLPLIDDSHLDRLPAYWSSVATLWVLGTACWFVGTREHGPAALGLAGIPLGSLVLWSLGLTGAGLVTIVVFRQIAIVSGALDSRLLRQLLPRTLPERRAFAVLSVAAGFGEEIAYRGYAIPVLVPLLGVAGALTLTSVIFGVLHAYQGPLGILRTGVLGGLLGLGFVATGSLWPAVLAHVAIDLVAGLWLGERLLPPRRG